MLRLFRTALLFLTVIPAGKIDNLKTGDLAASVSYFPAIGLLLGAILILGEYLFGFFLPSPALETLLVVVLIIFTGGLHLDGLMDTADGLFCGKPVERKLEIMRDSRTGAHGVTAAISVLLLKTAFLISLGNLRTTALLLTPVLSRLTLAINLKFFPYARSGEGLGRPFMDEITGREAVLAFLSALVFVHVWGGIRGIILIAVLTPVGYMFCRWLKNRLGGLTGDTCGALIELTEAAALLLFLIWG